MELIAKIHATRPLEWFSPAAEAVSSAAGRLLEFLSRLGLEAFLALKVTSARLTTRIVFGGDLAGMFAAYCPSGAIAGDDGRITGVWWTEVAADGVKVCGLCRCESQLALTRVPYVRFPSWRSAALLKAGFGRVMVFTYDPESHLHYDCQPLRAGTTEEIAARVLAGLSRFSGTGPASRDEVRACADLIAPSFDAFRASLGARALAIMSGATRLGRGHGQNETIIQSHWDAVDGVVDSPFLDALESHPEHASRIVELRRLLPGMCENASARRIATLAIMQVYYPKDSLPEAEAKASDRFLQLLRSAERMVDSSAEVNEALGLVVSGGDDVWSVDHDCTFACIEALARLPLDWIPVCVPEWTAFLTLAPSMVSAWHTAARRPMSEFAASGGRWVELLRRAGKAIGEEPSLGALKRAAQDLRDPPHALSDTIVKPALVLTDPEVETSFDYREWVGSSVCGTGLFYRDKSFVSCLAASGEWHRRRVAIDAARAAFPLQARALDGEADDEGTLPADGTWLALLPDWTLSGVELRVLTSRDALRAEGEKGPDRDGAAGLSHCAADYVGRCLRGDSRLVSLRGRTSGQGVVRLSTVEIETGKDYRLVQHRGFNNADPPLECVAAVDAYLLALRSGELPVDRTLVDAQRGFRPRRDRTESTLGTAGYDFRRPGAFAAVMEAWGRFLPRDARGSDPSRIAALVPPEIARIFDPPMA
jgi:hypothetical protein